MVWEEWQACLTTQGEGTIDFQQLITTRHARRLWATSSHTAVLFEFRAWERELSFSILLVPVRSGAHKLYGSDEVSLRWRCLCLVFSVLRFAFFSVHVHFSLLQDAR